jgi:hypothetical protein
MAGPACIVRSRIAMPLPNSIAAALTSTAIV